MYMYMYIFFTIERIMASDQTSMLEQPSEKSINDSRSFEWRLHSKGGRKIASWGVSQSAYQLRRRTRQRSTASKYFTASNFAHWPNEQYNWLDLSTQTHCSAWTAIEKNFHAIHMNFQTAWYTVYTPYSVRHIKTHPEIIVLSHLQVQRVPELTKQKTQDMREK